MPLRRDDTGADTPAGGVSLFGALLLRHRTLKDWTQEELAERAGLAPRTISDLERGVNQRPRPDTLHRLLRALDLSPEERDQLETAGRRRSWSLPDTPPDPLSSHDSHDGARHPEIASIHLDWDGAPDPSTFFGRGQESATLKRWIEEDGCRLVTVVGLAGVGKTHLSTKVGRAIAAHAEHAAARGEQPAFDYIIWRKLLNAPRLPQLLPEIIRFLSDQREVDMPPTVEQQIWLLLSYLGQRRCLLILDNVETIMVGGPETGHYRPGYEDYGALFQQIAEAPHTSCLMLTTREKPQEVARLETPAGPARSLSLGGLTQQDCQRLCVEVDASITGSEDDWKRLTSFYHGNPLALDLAARHIRDAYLGSISDFLHDERHVFADLRRLLGWYFDRLSPLQKEMMYWFTIVREPVTLAELRGRVCSPRSREELPNTLQSLQWLIPLERGPAGFTLQPVLLEYMSARLIEHIASEIAEERIDLLNSHALLLALAKDHVRESQMSIFIEPLLHLLAAQMGRAGLIQRLKRLLDLLRASPPPQPGYAAGSILNLLIALGADLRWLDFTGLPVWQAYLREASLQDVNFSRADLRQSAFTDLFGSILSVAFSPDPFETATVAAGTAAGEIRLWQARDGKPLATYVGHTDWVWALAFSPDGNLLASGSSDRAVRVWDIASGNCLHTLEGHQHRIRSVVFSPDGALLASASEDGRIGIWDPATGGLLHYLTGHANPVRALAFAPDNQTLVSGSDDHTIRVWNARSGVEERPPLRGHTSQVWSVALSPDGKTIASGSDDKTVRVWDRGSGKQLNVLDGHLSWICSLAFSPDGKLLASASADQTVRLWNPVSGQPVRVLQGHTNWVNSIAFSRDGAILASGSHDQTVRMWEVGSGYRLATLRGHSAWIRALAFSPDGSLLATADRALHLWEPGSGQAIATLSGHSAWIRALAFSPDGASIASGGDDKTTLLWATRPPHGSRTLAGHHNRVKAVAFNADGALLATGSDDGTVRLWDTRATRQRILRGHTNRVRAVAFSPTAPILASASDDETARLWDVTTGALLYELKGHTNRVWSLAFSPGGELLATAGEDGAVRLWDVMTGVCTAVLDGHEGPVWTVAFRPDGAVVASSSEDQTVRIWNTSTGECLHILSGHSKPIWAIAFSPDQVTLASGSHDHTVRLWNSYSGQDIAVLSGHTAPIWAVAFSPDGATLASGGDDGSCNLWDVYRRALRLTLRGERPYERMNILGATGLTEAQKLTLTALGAIEAPPIQ